MIGQSHSPAAPSTARWRRRPLGRYRYVRLRWRFLFAALDLVGGAIVKYLAVARRLLAAFWPMRETPAQDPRRIVLLQLDHLGDAVLSTGLVAELRRRWPQARIEVLASESNAEVFAALPEVDRVHLSRANRFARRRLRRIGWVTSLVYWGLRLRWRGVDLGIDVRGEFPLALILWLSGARIRLGWNCGGGGFLLTHSPQHQHGRPEMESRRALLAELGVVPAPGGADSFARPRFTAPEPIRRQIAAQWQQSERLRAAYGPRVALHLGAGSAAKRWPVEYWRELVRRLRDELDARVALVGGGGERSTALALLGERPIQGVVNLTGVLSIAELAAALAETELFVGGDSGPAHLAAAVGTPVIALFSGTNDPQQWAPPGSHVTVLRRPVACSPCHRQSCPLPDHPCLRGLAPQDVWRVVRERFTVVCEGPVP